MCSLHFECRLNDAFCFDTLNDHATALNDSRGEWRTAVLTHLLSGECVSSSSPSCKHVARDAPSTIDLSHLLRSLLLATPD